MSGLRGACRWAIGRGRGFLRKLLVNSTRDLRPCAPSDYPFSKCHPFVLVPDSTPRSIQIGISPASSETATALRVPRWLRTSVAGSALWGCQGNLSSAGRRALGELSEGCCIMGCDPRTKNRSPSHGASSWSHGNGCLGSARDQKKLLSHNSLGSLSERAWIISSCDSAGEYTVAKPRDPSRIEGSLGCSPPLCVSR